MTWNNLQRTRNDLKRPETTYNKQEMTWNDLQQVRNDMKWTTRTWKDLQQTRNNLKQLTTRKTQSIDLNLATTSQKRCKTTGNKQIFRLFYKMGKAVLFSNIFHPTIGCNHLSTASQRLMVTAELQTSLQYHLYFFMGHNIYFFLSGFHVKNINKSQDNMERERLFFFAPLYYFYPLCKSFDLQHLQLSERFNDERGRHKWIQEPYYILLYQNLYKIK